MKYLFYWDHSKYIPVCIGYNPATTFYCRDIEDIISTNNINAKKWIPCFIIKL